MYIPMLAVSLLISAGTFGSGAQAARGTPHRRPTTHAGAARTKVARLPSPSVDSTFAPPSASEGDGTVCPAFMKAIGRHFCIDTYEASLLEVRDDGSEDVWPYFKTVAGSVHVRAVSLPGVFPQGYVTGTQAKNACEASGKRLCKPAEWKMACMGPDKTTFPYGAKRREKACNDHGRSPMVFYFIQDGIPASEWKWGANGNMIDPRLNQLEGTLARTGEHEDCTNEYGVFDMVGNLHEWVDDPDGTFQGGYYLDTHINGDGCNYQTTAHTVAHADYSTGFRCCSDTEDL